MANERDVAGILVQKGAKIECLHKGGENLLLSMINFNNTANALFLLGIGVNPNAALLGNNTALMIAAAHGDLELSRALLEKGADVNAVGPVGTSALINAASSGNLEIMKMLLDRGAKVSPRSSQGYTPLRIAKERRNIPMIELLEKAGALE